MESTRLPQIAGVRFGGVAALIKRIENTVLLGIPIAGTFLAVWHSQMYGVTLTTLMTFLGFYLWTALGGSLGLHRYFTHRSFKASLPVRIFLGMGACFNMQGRIMRWVADHRRHHHFEDSLGDPHSPTITADGRRLPRVRGLLHAHFWWMFDDSTSEPAVFCPDLLTDRFVQRFETLYYLCVAISLLLPMTIGFTIGGRVEAIRCLLWAGCARVFLMQQTTFSINSLGHSFGPQDFGTRDSSRNLWLFSILLLGDGYHNNHHAFPASARVALLPGQFDPGYTFLRALERVRLVHDIVTIPPELIKARLGK
jgi:stearoyl-CoA desaturase (delta-9 desaturase)